MLRPPAPSPPNPDSQPFSSSCVASLCCSAAKSSSALESLPSSWQKPGCVARVWLLPPLPLGPLRLQGQDRIRAQPTRESSSRSKSRIQVTDIQSGEDFGNRDWLPNPGTSGSLSSNSTRPPSNFFRKEKKNQSGNSIQPPLPPTHPHSFH